MKHEKLLHVTSELHTSSKGAATPTSLQWQKLSKGLLGPQVSFEEVRCHYIQLEMRSFRMNGKTQQGICIDGWLKPLLPSTQSKLPHSVPIRTYTNTRIFIYKVTYKSQEKQNYLLQSIKILLFPATSYPHCFMQDGWITQNTQGDSRHWGHPIVLSGSGDIGRGLEGGKPGRDCTAEDKRSCHKVSLLARLEECFSTDSKVCSFGDGKWV